MPKIILASSSPRRASLLKQVGLEFEIIPSNYVEDHTLKMPQHRLTVFFARSKAEEVASRVDEGLIIGADTVVFSEGDFLGKPGSAEEAFVMLKKLSGTCHQVTTGLALLDKKNGNLRTLHSTTNVWFRLLTDEEITSYIMTGEPFDKAGAYGIQGRAALFVDRIQGCYFNVVGLPLSKLAGILTESGFKIM